MAKARSSNVSFVNTFLNMFLFVKKNVICAYYSQILDFIVYENMYGPEN